MRVRLASDYIDRELAQNSLAIDYARGPAQLADDRVGDDLNAVDRVPSDGDTRIDFRTDTAGDQQCVSSVDLSELGPPACSNGLDDDSDGAVDASDPGCASTTDTSEKGSTIHTKTGHIDVPAVAPTREADPTGVGDAYRGGLLKGLAHGLEWEACGRLGSVAATYALEHLGGLSHAYTLDEFRGRYAKHFGPAPF